MPGTGTIRLKVNARMRIGCINPQQSSRGHSVECLPGFQHRQRAIQPLHIQMLIVTRLRICLYRALLLSSMLTHDL